MKAVFGYAPDGQTGAVSAQASKKELAPAPVPEPEPEKTPDVPLRPVEDLDRAYRTFLKYLTLEYCHKRELMEHDGWSEDFLREVLKRAPIRSLPPSDSARMSKESKRAREFAQLTGPFRRNVLDKTVAELGPDALLGVPGFFREEGRKWQIEGADGYLIPQYNVEGLIYRLRIRLSKEAQAEKEERTGRKVGKYLQISSPGRENGCGGTSQLGFYGLWHLDRYKHGEIDRVVVCEGEKKGIVAALKLGLLVITLPGVKTFKLLDSPLVVSGDWKGPVPTALEWLKSIGVKRITVCNDQDMFTNDTVLKATEDVINLIKMRGFRAEVGLWDEKYKGIDDALIAGAKIIKKQM